jgi:hypothetical protein
MAHPSGSGGTSLAPTPTHPHYLSRETSKDELEMAESLRRLNQAHDHHVSRTATPSHTQRLSPSPREERPEIYHSLEDAKPMLEGTATPTTLSSLPLPPNSGTGASAPISGQVCRYVTPFLVQMLLPIVVKWAFSHYTCRQGANDSKQLQDNSDTFVASLTNWRDCL